MDPSPPTQPITPLIPMSSSSYKFDHLMSCWPTTQHKGTTKDTYKKIIGITKLYKVK